MRHILFLFPIFLVACSGASPSGDTAPAVLASSAQKNVGTAKLSWNGETQLTRQLRYSKDGLSFDAPVTLPNPLPASISVSLPSEYSLFQSAAMEQKDLLAKTNKDGVLIVANVDQFFPKDKGGKASLHLKSQDGIHLTIDLRLPPLALDFTWSKPAPDHRKVTIGSDSLAVLAELVVTNPNEESVEMNMPNLSGVVSQRITNYSLQQDYNDVCPYMESVPSAANRSEQASLLVLPEDSLNDSSAVLPGSKSFSLKGSESKTFLLLTNSTLAQSLLDHGGGYGSGRLSLETNAAYMEGGGLAKTAMRAPHCVYSKGLLRVGAWPEQPSLAIQDDASIFSYRYASLPANDDPAFSSAPWFNTGFTFF